jgi:hypothetical protein
LHPEQGLGDVIQFSRYVPLVAQRGARVILALPEQLHALFADFREIATFVDAHSAALEADFHCPLMSLPLAFDTREEDISGAPYLAASSGKVESWQDRLGQKSRPRIGVVWSGNPLHANDHNRSIPLTIFQELVVPGVDYFSLQKGMRPEDEAELERFAIFKRTDAEIHDFTDTAALIQLMDLVITVDTSVAHLAGALG